MKRKPIRIDWDALEEAFNNQNVELVYYLDAVTGHVLLEGEGEEDEFDDEEGRYEHLVAAEAPRRDDATRVRVERLDTSQKIEWMRTFLREDEGLAGELVSRLERALEAEDPAKEIGQILRDNPEEKDRWFLYRSDRLHELIDAWLEANQVVAVDPPPWKR